MKNLQAIETFDTDEQTDRCYAALLLQGYKRYFLADDSDTLINEAKNYFMQAAQTDSERPEAFLGLGLCYYFLSDYKTALHHIEQALLIGFGTGDYEEIRYEHIPEDADPDNPDVFVMGIAELMLIRASIFYFLDDINAAQHDLDAVFENINDEYAAFKNLLRAEIYLERNDIIQARRYLGEVLVLEPNDPEAHTLRGLILSEEGDADNAIKAFSYVLKLLPDNIDALLARAEEYQIIGATEKMQTDIDTLRTLIGASSESTPLHNRLNQLEVDGKTQ
jgi:tetratricopeptide (TPR) repeat protein